MSGIRGLQVREVEGMAGIGTKRSFSFIQKSTSYNLLS
jgi:hypothetical protein